MGADRARGQMSTNNDVIHSLAACLGQGRCGQWNVVLIRAAAVSVIDYLPNVVWNSCCITNYPITLKLLLDASSHPKHRLISKRKLACNHYTDIDISKSCIEELSVLWLFNFFEDADCEATTPTSLFGTSLANASSRHLSTSVFCCA